MKKSLCTLLILSTLLLTLAGCSGDEPDTTTDTTTGSVEEAPDPLDSMADDDLLFGSEYVFDDYSPYLKVGDLNGITASRAEADRLLSEFLAEVLAYYQGVDFVDAPEDAVVAMGDRATIHYVGYSADPEFEISEDTLKGMTNKTDEAGHGLVIGSGSFIHAYESEEHPENNNPSFEEQLIGVKAGETVTITVTFPDVYQNSPELQGRPIKFDVTVEKIENPDPDEPTELTDDLVNDYTGGQYTTVASLSEYQLNVYKSQLAYDDIVSRISVIDYPKEQYDDLLKSYMDYYTYDDISIEELLSLQESGEKAVKEIIDEELTLNFLYSHYGVTLTKAEYLKKLQEAYDENAMIMMYYYGVYSVEGMEDFFTRDYWISYFKSQKLTDQLAEIAAWAD